MEKENKIKLIRIIISTVLLAAAFIVTYFVDMPMWSQLLIYLVPYFTIGYDVFFESAENIVHGEIFDEDFLMSIATIGALCIGFLPGAKPEFAEAVFVMLLFQVGELLENLAEGKSRKSIAALVELKPDTVNTESDGNLKKVSPEDVKVGDIIVVMPGERIPLDGTVIEGTTSLDTAALTGESIPRTAAPGDPALSGCINISGMIKIEVTKPYKESTVSRIMELIENADETKSSSEKFIDKFAKYYTPIVVISALILAFVPPIISGAFSENIAVWLRRALTFLVISCPCALVISVPLAFFGGIGLASSKGILIKGSNYIDILAKASTVVFDKTGTLTKGNFKVTSIHPEKCSENHLLHIASHVERYSTHPIALSLREAYGEEADACIVEDIKEIAGEGITAAVNGQSVCCGNEKLMESQGILYTKCDCVGTKVHVAIDGEYAGHIVISDQIKEDSVSAIKDLKDAGIKKCVMLTGDKENIAKDISDKLNIDEYHSELLPQQKAEYINSLSDKGKVIFAGDGINDAPVLVNADAGIAMGAMGSDAAIEAADVVIMDDKPSKIVTAINISKRTLRIAKTNIAFAIAVKLIVLVLAAFGIAPMYLAIFADVGVTVLAVFNSMRTLKYRP